MASTARLVDLYSAYAVGLDTADTRLFLSCFTDDAVLESPARTVRGHEELTAWMSLSRLGVVHHSFNVLVLEEFDQGISSRADWVTYEAGETLSTGTYRDTVRVDGQGVPRFSRRVITYTWRRTPPTPA
ncbi:nuclear transport factor 2 family protein [Modestobacter versicolor]|uniref:nuclear transport factor 2 family protein n=1 Tax=Modestobacter versicolor TaxID=429133 RepID=UPI0034E00BD3